MSREMGVLVLTQGVGSDPTAVAEYRENVAREEETAAQRSRYQLEVAVLRRLPSAPLESETQFAQWPKLADLGNPTHPSLGSLFSSRL